jgi:tyrosine-specific transport protein
MVKKNLLNPVALLAGTAMGAGFLGIPYMVAKSGFLIGLIHLIVIGLFVLFVQLCLGEIVLRTKGNHHLAGYAGKYLGKNGKKIVLIIMLFYIFSALIAYLLASGQSLSYIIFGSSNYALHFTILFWLFVSSLTFIGLRALKHFGKAGFFMIILFILLIVMFYSKSISMENLTYVVPSNFLFPLGVVLFSYFSFSSIPAAERLLLGRENLMKKAILLGVLIPFIVYLTFTFVLLGSFGNAVPQVATLALGRFFAIVGLVAIFTSFLSLSISIRDVFRFDFKVKRFKSWFLCTIIPMILFIPIYFFNLVSFVQILSIVGMVSGGFSAILILMINLKSKKVGKRIPEYSVFLNGWLVFLVGLFLVFGMLTQLNVLRPEKISKGLLITGAFIGSSGVISLMGGALFMLLILGVFVFVKRKRISSE